MNGPVSIELQKMPDGYLRVYAVYPTGKLNACLVELGYLNPAAEDYATYRFSLPDQPCEPSRIDILENCIVDLCGKLEDAAHAMYTPDSYSTEDARKLLPPEKQDL